MIENEDLTTMKVIGKGKGAILGLTLNNDKTKILFIDSDIGVCSLDLKTGTVSILVE